MLAKAEPLITLVLQECRIVIVTVKLDIRVGLDVFVKVPIMFTV